MGAPRGAVDQWKAVIGQGEAVEDRGEAVEGRGEAVTHEQLDNIWMVEFSKNSYFFLNRVKMVFELVLI